MRGNSGKIRLAATTFVLITASGAFAGRTICVDDDGPADFSNIQSAIDECHEKDIIIVREGTYSENINFNGKNITLTSSYPTDVNIVARTIIDGDRLGSVVTFDGTESPECVLRGFTITGGRNHSGGGIYGNRTMASIENNIIVGNIATGGPNWDGKGGGIYACDGATRGNIISNNQALYAGGGIYAFDGIIQNNLIYGNCADLSGGGGIYSYGNYPSYTSCPTITNCTIVHNAVGVYSNGRYARGGGILCSRGNYHLITNCIIHRNVADHGPEIALMDYCVNPTEPVATLTIAHSNIRGGRGMVYTDACCDLVWDDSNINTDPCFVEPENGDYHLKSQAGRWDTANQSWVRDDVTSPCIDAGDAMCPIGAEPFPNGGRVNMGAYGGTAEASKSYFGEPLCETIVAGDINGDCKVDVKDFAIMALHWLDDDSKEPRLL